jgi:hypothetical protein
MAAAGGVLVTGGCSGTQRAAKSVAAGDASTIATNTPIIVVTEPVSRDVKARGNTWIYIKEILQHAGLFFRQMSPSNLPSLLHHSNTIVLLVGDLRLAARERDILSTFVKKGRSLIGIGGTSGLDQVFGISGKRPLMEGWMKVTAQDHPVTADLRSSLHVFGGYAVKTDSATSLAELESGRQGAKGSAILENRWGKGQVLLLAPDLVFSIVHIQQGVPVFQDGKPAPDGSAPIDDGELKAEDGLVLDWQRDRTPMQPDGVPVFLEPISDELRGIILRSIFHLTKHQGIPLPMLWYWPRSLNAVGHISHDTDGNDPEKAVALLEVMNTCKVKSTWCTLYPGGYPREFYSTLKQQGFEIGLHYDARSGDAQTLWSRENFLLQHRWLKETAGLERIVSNKNHYTRWEARLDFWRWCEQVGIHCDQTRGPSKKGTIGFPLGGSHPYFPLDDEADSPRFLKVLEVNMLTQDLGVVCPRQYGRQLLDSVLRQYGVAHFLFHPAHILKPNVADTLSELVSYGRAQGLEWWTSEQIYEWEKLRRSVEAIFEPNNTLRLHTTKPLRESTLLFLNARQAPGPIRINGQPMQSTRRRLYGFEFDAVTVDLDGEVKVQFT